MNGKVILRESMLLLAGVLIGVSTSTNSTVIAQGYHQRPAEPTATRMPTPTPMMYDWATERWQDYASHIVASEARGVPAADVVVACTMVRDVERGWGAYNLRGRWYGWGTPDEADRQAVRLAVDGGCDNVPHYIYVGSFGDAQHWARIGMIYGGPFDLYLGRGGQAVVGVPAQGCGR